MVEYTKKLTIQTTERVFKELKSTLVIKKISGGMYGSMDEFLIKMIRAMEENTPTLDISFKEERDE